MNKKIIFVLLMVFLTACNGSNNGDNAQLEKEIYKGTQGVILETYSTKLPDEVYEDEEINYVIKVENKGPYDTTGKVLVSVEKGYMEFGDGSNVIDKPISLEGKDVFNTYNDFQVIEDIMIHVKDLDPLSEYHDSVVLTSFCYAYEGIAIADVCIDTDPHNIRPKDKVCTSKSSIGLSEGQGGPVVIESIEPKMLIDGSYVKPQFKINVYNSGSGTVISSDSINKVCSKDGLSTETYNSIKIEDVTFSTFNKADITCIPDELVLRKERDSITCTFNKNTIRNTDAAFVTPLEIHISYGYTESTSKEIQIKNNPIASKPKPLHGDIE